MLCLGLDSVPLLLLTGGKDSKFDRIGLVLSMFELGVCLNSVSNLEQ